MADHPDLDTSMLQKLVQSKKKVPHTSDVPPIDVITLSDDEEETSSRRRQEEVEMEEDVSMDGPSHAQEDLSMEDHSLLSSTMADVMIDTSGKTEMDDSIDRSRQTENTSIDSRSRSISRTPSDGQEPDGQKIIRCTDGDAAEEAMRQLYIDKPWERVERWIRAEEKEEPVDPNDEQIDIFVRDFEDKPTSYWEEMAEEWESQGKEYKFDYIVAAQPNLKPDEALMKNRLVLIKWAEFAIPTWGKVATINTVRGKVDQVYMMDQRLRILERLEGKLKAEMKGNNFDKIYPHRWLPRVEEKNAYVQDERARYENRLRGGEWRMNYEYERAHEEKLKKQGAGCKDPAPAPLYMVNWVDDSPVPGVDKAYPFKFITKLKPTQRVASILANCKELAWVKCTECCASCTYPREHYHTMKSCCGVSYGAVHHIGDNKRLVGRWEEPEEEQLEKGVEEEIYVSQGHLTVQEIESNVVVECTEDCVCKGQCKQRLVQRGRQAPLIIFREEAATEKGWGLRAGASIKRGEFVTEYIGQVLTAKEQADYHAGSHYMLDMRVGWSENLQKTDRVRGEFKPQRRNHKPFSVDATHMGNEARYINHSCEPNLIAMVTFVERHGEFYHRIAFFARKNISFGEELTFDYFPAADVEAWKKMFKKCSCGSPVCKFNDLEDKSEKRKAEQERMEEEEEEEDEDDDWKSVDSFLSDDDEFRRQCTEVEVKKQRAAEKEERKRERERRAKAEERRRRRAKGEEEEEEDEEEEREGHHHMAHVDMMRNPFDLIVDRVGSKEEAKRVMDERIEGKNGLKGILHLFGEWCPIKHAKMLEEAKASKAAKAEERRAAEEEMDREQAERRELRRKEDEKKKERAREREEKRGGKRGTKRSST